MAGGSLMHPDRRDHIAKRRYYRGDDIAVGGLDRVATIMMGRRDVVVGNAMLF